MNSLQNLARRIDRLYAERSPAPFVVLTLKDGTQTPPLLWVDAMSYCLNGKASAVETDDLGIKSLLAAMIGGKA